MAPVPRGHVVLAVVLPLVAVLGIVLVDSAAADDALLGCLAAVPLLAAAFGSPRQVGLVSVVSFVAVAGTGGEEAAGSAAQPLRLAIVAGCAVLAVLAAARRGRREQRLGHAEAVLGEVAHAVQRPLPPQLGEHRVAARYLAADALARLGGDFYEVLETPFGLRAVVGDVRGKGLPAIRLATYLTGSFREAAVRGSSLADVAAAMDATVVRESREEEDFATAVLVEVRPHEVLVLRCGHPWPFVITDGAVTELRGRGDVPLGMGAGSLEPQPIPPQGSLLLVSDGVTEARDAAGHFLDLPAAVVRAQAHPGGLLVGLETQLRQHAAGRRDDVAMLLLGLEQVRPPAPAHAVQRRGALA